MIKYATIMNHFIFWIYFISTVIGSISIFSVFILYFYKKSEWQKKYILFLLSILLMLINYTVFYFIYIYGHKIIELLDRIYLFSIFSMLTFFIYILLQMILDTFDTDRKKEIRIFFYSIFFLMFAVFIPSLILGMIILIFSGTVLYALIISLLLLLPIIRWKKIFIIKEKRSFLIIVLLLIILIPFQILEFYLRYKSFKIASYTPLGLISFASFSAIIFLFNLFYSTNKIIKLYSNKINELDLHEAFIKKFLITEREKEIIKLLLQGKSHKQVAWDLFISDRTVNRHVYNIYQKCNVKTLIELINLLKEYK